eukprot:Nitzschia sp. Nitz4//scaffold305_size22082//11037//12551//NITZ4_008582-RA/size22082-processed-gene-0.3-mRNA-1//-1//CDS//3329547089//7274//frame0
MPSSPPRKTARKAVRKAPSGGVEALIPSLIGVGVLLFGVLAQQGFRGRSFVAGIDLGTTNSVVCVQAQSKSVGAIDCIPDPVSHSPIVPSVVSLLEAHESHPSMLSSSSSSNQKYPSSLIPPPSRVVVGQPAKARITSHPALTVYHAKRLMGHAFSDKAVQELQKEVEFSIRPVPSQGDDGDNNNDNNKQDNVAFALGNTLLTPTQVGSHVVHHLIQMTQRFLGHDNIQSAVLAVPAKFDTLQRQRTMEAFLGAGIKVARVLEEPTAAALAYGLHKKEGVEKILVYDFGGGTLDISILHVSEGYCEVMGSDGDDQLGGADFDAAVAAIFAQQHANVLEALASYPVHAEDIAAACPQVTESFPLCTVSSFHTIGERLKIALSASQEIEAASCWALPPTATTTSLSHDEMIQHVCPSMTPLSLSLSLESYNQASEPLFQRALLPVARLLQDLTISPQEIDEIVMVGGTTRMPQIRALVAQQFSTAQMNTHIDPDLTVAYGAASVID